MQQRAKGKSHQAAVRALAYKWIKIMSRCWQTSPRSRIISSTISTPTFTGLGFFLARALAQN
jgi:hypothetical protein